MAVVKGIRGYIKWALRDVGIDQHRTQPNMLVQAYPPDFCGAEDDDSDGSDFAPSPTGNDDDGEGDNDQETTAIADERLDPAYLEAQRARRFTRAVSRDLERRLLSMGKRWRDQLRDDKKKGKGFVAPPPTLYAFAVVQHIVMLASHDPGAATNPVIMLEQVRLNDRSQWLWNALSIALPVIMARDTLDGMWETGVVVAERRDSESDPDL